MMIVPGGGWFAHKLFNNIFFGLNFLYLFGIFNVLHGLYLWH